MPNLKSYKIKIGIEARSLFDSSRAAHHTINCVHEATITEKTTEDVEKIFDDIRGAIDDVIRRASP